MSDFIIELKDISYTNVDYLVLKDINLKIHKNSFTSIIGKSGSGKSTLIKLIAGILKPDKGQVLMNGVDINELSEVDLIKYRSKLGFVFQDSGLISNLTIRENFLLVLEFHKPDMDKKKMNDLIYESLLKVNMEDSINDRPAQLSMGEKKLVSFARAMILKPDILFLDEALASIDASQVKKTVQLCNEFFMQNDKTIIAVTNLKHFVIQLATRIIMIENKKIIIDENKEKLLKTDKKDLPESITDLLYE